MTKESFQIQMPSEARPLALLKRFFLLLFVLYLVSGLESSYRAFYQVRSLELHSTDRILRADSNVKTEVVSYGRTHVDVKVELIQGEKSETLARQLVPGNYFAALDPRWQRATQTIALTPEVVARFQPSAAILRATATGRPQWTRLPPPLVRELAVEIQRLEFKRSV
jgi:hypothetical protein